MRRIPTRTQGDVVIVDDPRITGPAEHYRLEERPDGWALLRAVELDAGPEKISTSLLAFGLESKAAALEHLRGILQAVRPGVLE